MIVGMQQSGKLPNLPKEMRGLYQSAMIKVLHEAVDPVIADIASRPQPESIARAYRTRHYLTGNSVRLDVLNLNENWKWKERDTRGAPRSWPPYRAGSSLEAWSRRHGIPAFLVARKIARYGTKGNYLFSTIYESSRRRIIDAIQAGQAAFIRDVLGGVL